MRSPGLPVPPERLPGASQGDVKERCGAKKSGVALSPQSI